MEDHVEKNPRTSSLNKAVIHDETVHSAAERGHAATDNLGRSLLTFDKAAEFRLRLKIDLYIIPTVAILYLFCFIDRANIGNARLAGFEADLKLKGYDYNTVLSVFYISWKTDAHLRYLANAFIRLHCVRDPQQYGLQGKCSNHLC